MQPRHRAVWILKKEIQETAQQLIPMCEAFGRRVVHCELDRSKNPKVKVHVCVEQQNRYSNTNGENAFKLWHIPYSRCGNNSYLFLVSNVLHRLCSDILYTVLNNCIHFFGIAIPELNLKRGILSLHVMYVDGGKSLFLLSFRTSVTSFWCFSLILLLSFFSSQFIPSDISEHSFQMHFWLLSNIRHE